MIPEGTVEPMAKKSEDGMTLEQLTGMLASTEPAPDTPLMVEVYDETGEPYEISIKRAGVTLGFYGRPSKVVLYTD